MKRILDKNSNTLNIHLPQCEYLVKNSSAHLDIFTEQVCIEAQPVPGDVESSLQQDVSQQCTGINYRRRDVLNQELTADGGQISMLCLHLSSRSPLSEQSGTVCGTESCTC